MLILLIVKVIIKILLIEILINITNMQTNNDQTSNENTYIPTNDVYSIKLRIPIIIALTIFIHIKMF